METQYFYRIAHGHQSRIRVLMNDIPFYKRGPTEYAVTFTNGANHLLLPGDNVMTIELYEGPDNFQVTAEITIDHDHDHPVARIDWPLAGGLPRVLPFVMFHPVPHDGAQLPAGVPPGSAGQLRAGGHP